MSKQTGTSPTNKRRSGSAEYPSRAPELPKRDKASGNKHKSDDSKHKKKKKKRRSQGKSQTHRNAISPLKAKILGEKRDSMRRLNSGAVALTDFDLIKKVGCGSYGEVYLAVHKKSRRKFALKQMQKDLIVKLKNVERVKTEKNILKQASSPFLLRLYYSFQDSQCVYLATTFCPGKI